MAARKTDRNAEIVRHYMAGAPLREIAASFGLTIQRVSHIAGAAGCPRRPGVADAPTSVRRRWGRANHPIEDPHRERQIAALTSAGRSYSEVAAELGLASRNVVAGALHRLRRRELADPSA